MDILLQSPANPRKPRAHRIKRGILHGLLPAGNSTGHPFKIWTCHTLTPPSAGVRFEMLAVGIVQRQMMLIGHAVIDHLKLVGLQPTRFAFVELGPRGLVIAIFRHEGQARFQRHGRRAVPDQETPIAQGIALHFLEPNINARQMKQIFAVAHVANKQMSNRTTFVR